MIHKSEYIVMTEQSIRQGIVNDNILGLFCGEQVPTERKHNALILDYGKNN